MELTKYNRLKKLEKGVDIFMDTLAQKGKNSRNSSEKTFDFDKWCEEIDQHPAFARELKPTDNGQYSAEMQALQAMKYDEDDPTECAIAYKEEGNRHFGDRNYRWAVDAYTKGIRMRCADVRLNSVLFANRSAANRRLGNVRSAFKDCFFARRFDSENLKAIRRGAECLLELGEAAKCIAWIESDERGVVSQKAQEDEQLQKTKKKAEAMRAQEDRDARRERAKASAEWRRDTKLLEALRTRGIRLCPPVDEPDELCQHFLISFGSLHAMVRLAEGAESARLIWPLLLQYPQKGQTDFVAECAEDIPLAEALVEVFASPAPWDPSHQFRSAQFISNVFLSSNNVRLFVSLSCADGGERIREIFPVEHSLGVVLQWSDVCVAKGLPVIQVYTKWYLEHTELETADEGNDIFYFEKE